MIEILRRKTKNHFILEVSYYRLVYIVLFSNENTIGIFLMSTHKRVTGKINQTKHNKNLSLSYKLFFKITLNAFTLFTNLALFAQRI